MHDCFVGSFIKRKTSDISSDNKWQPVELVLVGLVFQMAISFFAYVATFLEQLYFRGRHFFTLLQSNYFNITITFFGVASSSKPLLFWGAPFFFFFFQNILFFRAELLPSSHFLRIKSSIGQLLFGSTEELHLGKVNFSEKKYSPLPTFFWKATCWE